MSETLLIVLYVIGLIIGYLIILFLIAKGTIDNNDSDRNSAYFILVLWPISIPSLVALFLVALPFILLADAFKSLEEKIINYFKGNKK